MRLDAGGFGAAGYINPIDQVISGTVDFGVTDAASIIQARAAGVPIVGVAALFQRSPLALIALEKTGIKRPQDLVGRNVSVADGGARQLYDTLLSAQKIDPSAVDPEDVEMLEDLVLTAVQDALDKSAALAEEKMGALTGGLKIPGLM